MKRILLGALGAVVLAAVSAMAAVSLGLIPFSADEPHSEAVRSLIVFARERSIAMAAVGVTIPDDLASPERIRRGAGNYEAMCAGCHLSPGAADTEIRKGLYPQPTNLSTKAEGQAVEAADARRFQIVKHGVKGSGMPAWSKGGMDDGAIWDLVAFVRVLPDTSPAGYRALVEVSDGHSHAGMEGMGHEHGQHDHGAHPHAHAGHDHHGH
ncbi:MAG TPA: cytochrome c [Accumulibacter sp.]|uniref:c-type cytochrome n=1 Tax=Accumulibacter sp. TaxID=2053492 RepID=UPI0025F7C142|nr:cytochrome c [Accumulibacter sp.]MCM8600612.1 cytochrome c [Accumulibacter sp.]MCM8664763.1 cytochrome c [Accumulibacter sp.]HNC52200.1 cytochrome c [Accumulibacter sp.]HNO64795.1 cytochrome c [Tepidiformaceae bacterium]